MDSRDIANSLKSIHSMYRGLMESKDIEGLAYYMGTFLRDDVNVNELKTWLLITRGLATYPQISGIRAEILSLFQKLMAEQAAALEKKNR